jgi:methionine-S-sulfoxide reductase
MRTEIVYFAGGCFWCTEAVFRQAEGVLSVTPGYTGGQTPDPTYEQVCSGKTGHAEAIRVEYNPSRISFETLLDIFWRSHDPTQMNRQGADVGTQYRSAIFLHNGRPSFRRAVIQGTPDSRRGAGRDRNRTGRPVLPSRGLSPQLLRTKPERPLLPMGYCAEAQETERCRFGEQPEYAIAERSRSPLRPPAVEMRRCRGSC